jgi:hypothetical protein
MEKNKKIHYKMDEITISHDTPKVFDYLYVSLNNIEARAWSAIRELLKKKIHIHNLIVIDFFGQQDKISSCKELQNSLFIDEIRFIRAEKQMYVETFKIIKNKTSNSITKKIIGIDISCIPTPQFFLILKWLEKCNAKVVIYYTEPQKYIMNDGIFKSYFSMKGPVSVEEIRGFSGATVNGDEVDRILLCMLGFDNDLLPTVIQDAGPGKIVAINGFPSFYPKFKDISMANNEKILSNSAFADKLEKSKSLTNFIYVEADNPFDSYNVLEELKSKYSKMCIDVVPLGTKPMALGVCMFAIENNDVRVLFPFPDEYADATGEKSKKTLEYILN